MQKLMRVEAPSSSSVQLQSPCDFQATLSTLQESLSNSQPTQIERNPALNDSHTYYLELNDDDMNFNFLPAAVQTVIVPDKAEKSTQTSGDLGESTATCKLESDSYPRFSNKGNF